MRLTPLVTLAAITLLPACQPPPPEPGGAPLELGAMPAAVRDSLERLLARHRVPGASLAFVSLDSTGWVGGAGLTSATRGRPVDAATVFEAASLSKPVFAYAVTRLAEDGVLSLGATMADLGAPTHAVDPDALSRITPATLLSHTSGLPPRPDSTGRLPLLRPPGVSWSYSGPGYVLLQQTLVDRMGFFDFDAMAHTLLFGPLGMGHSAFRWREDFDSLAAQGHDARGRAQSKWKPSPDDEARVGAASSLHTSAEDMARFLRAVLVDTTATRTMTRPQVRVAPELGLSWGQGWAVEEWQGERTFFHWGANPYFRSFVMGSLDQRYALVLLTNGTNGLEMADEVVALLTGRHHPLFRFYMLHPTD